MEFQKGEQVRYLYKDLSQYILATIIDIHYDDNIPYYTIETCDGREINTVHQKLFKLDKQTRIN